jgi:Cof subfamily protein (haloacid dehalogenase superfamily)
MSASVSQPTTPTGTTSTIQLLLADVDGTLVTPDKVLTDRARKAVIALRDRSIAFAITSGRPPRGMSMLIEPLGITTPVAGFNGGMLTRPDLTPIDLKTIPAALVPEIVRSIVERGLDAWVYRGNDWFVRKLDAPHVSREQQTVRFPPIVDAELARQAGQGGPDSRDEGVVKIVGVSDDFPAVAACEQELQRRFGSRVSAARSQPYYVDVTHPDANKGHVLRRLSEVLSIPLERIATIGDMPNDVVMFQPSGLSIAMGNASQDVQRSARCVTSSNEEEGFAQAVERFVLNRTAG